MFIGTIDALGNLTQLSELYVREHWIESNVTRFGGQFR